MTNRNGKTYAMMTVEARYPGMDIRDILTSLYKSRGSLGGVARELGFPVSTIAYWFRRLGIEQVR